MTKLSVNINKIAVIRNSRGGHLPNILQMAQDCERFGADGITVHPRPDERHITRQDVHDLKPLVKTEFNIEGYPTPKFMDLVTLVKPHQVTLVPDPPQAITSSYGWDVITNKVRLKSYVDEFKQHGIRVSIFVDPDPKQVEAAIETGTDRIELYTEAYAFNYFKNKEQAIEPYFIAAQKAQELGLGLNAGHDLNLDNLAYFKKIIPGLREVSIGHALICDALYFGIENTIQLYKRQLNIAQ